MKQSPAPQRFYARIEWSNEPLRAEKRIRRQMELVTLLVWKGFTIAQIAAMRRIGDARLPSERTLRRWTAQDMLGFGKEYHQFMRARSIQRLGAGIASDFRQIRARVERQAKVRESQAREILRRIRTPDRTR